MTINMNPVKDLVTRGTRFLSLGTDDRNGVSRVTQGSGLAPDSPIKGHRKILYDDAN
jgi:hypothetical protein